MQSLKDMPNGYKGEPVGIVVLIILVCALPFVIGAWHQESGHGVLVAAFGDGARVVRFVAKGALPDRENASHFAYDPKRGDQACTPTGELDVKKIPDRLACAGTRGHGNIVCAGGRSMTLQWLMDSCQSGSGGSLGKGSAKFHFAYARNQESALDALDQVMARER